MLLSDAYPERQILNVVLCIGMDIHLCSFLAALAAYLQYAGNPQAYDTHQGISGAAYRRIWYPIDRWVNLLNFIQVAPSDPPRDMAMFIVGEQAYRWQWFQCFPTRVGYTWLGSALALGSSGTRMPWTYPLAALAQDRDGHLLPAVGSAFLLRDEHWSAGPLSAGGGSAETAVEETC
jgi:hypothetical protein